MKKYFIISFILVIFLSCNRTLTPKDTLIEFVVTLKQLDFEKAQIYLTDDTKEIFNAVKVQFQNSDIFKSELVRSKSISKVNVIKKYSLDQFGEIINGKNAIVQSKDSTNQIRFENLNGKWKIVCNQKLLFSILFEEKNRERIDSEYKNLQLQYSKKATLIKMLIESSNSTEKPQIKIKLDEIENLSNESANILQFAKKQDELSDIISSFLVTNKIAPDLQIQLESIENRIMIAKRVYNDLVLEYNSGFGEKISLFPSNLKEKKIEIDFSI